MYQSIKYIESLYMEGPLLGGTEENDVVSSNEYSGLISLKIV